MGNNLRIWNKSSPSFLQLSSIYGSVKASQGNTKLGLPGTKHQASTCTPPWSCATPTPAESLGAIWCPCLHMDSQKHEKAGAWASSYHPVMLQHWAHFYGPSVSFHHKQSLLPSAGQGCTAAPGFRLSRGRIVTQLSPPRSITSALCLLPVHGSAPCWGVPPTTFAWDLEVLGPCYSARLPGDPSLPWCSLCHLYHCALVLLLLAGSWFYKKSSDNNNRNNIWA